jgi:hypothetical protein
MTARFCVFLCAMSTCSVSLAEESAPTPPSAQEQSIQQPAISLPGRAKSPFLGEVFLLGYRYKSFSREIEFDFDKSSVDDIEREHTAKEHRFLPLAFGVTLFLPSDIRVHTELSSSKVGVLRVGYAAENGVESGGVVEFDGLSEKSETDSKKTLDSTSSLKRLGAYVSYETNADRSDTFVKVYGDFSYESSNEDETEEGKSNEAELSGTSLTLALSLQHYVTERFSVGTGLSFCSWSMDGDFSYRESASSPKYDGEKNVKGSFWTFDLGTLGWRF